MSIWIIRGRPFTPFWEEKSVLRQLTVMKIWDTGEEKRFRCFDTFSRQIWMAASIQSRCHRQGRLEAEPARIPLLFLALRYK